MFSFAIGPLLTVLATILVAHPPSIEQNPNRPEPQIPVFIVSVDAMNGVTHPRADLQEIVDALRKEIAKRAGLRLVPAADSPLVTVVVTHRQTSPRLPSNTRRLVAVRLLYLDADANMTAFDDQEAAVDQTAWNKVIVKLAEQLEAWIGANRQILLRK